MHVFNIVHFDIKPANVLIETLPDKSYRCVICDFGFAMVIGTERKVVAGINRPELGGFTSHYASPEASNIITLPEKYMKFSCRCSLEFTLDEA